MAVVVKESFVGREVELSTLNAMLGRVRDGRPAFVLIDGAAGIGKTALVNRFLAQAPDVQVLRAAGDETEERVPYGVIDQLLRHGGVVDGLAGATASWVGDRSAVGAAALNPIDAGSRLLDLVGSVQNDGPVAIVVDDAHWSDPQSLRAFLFAIRRLSADEVLTIVAARTEDLGKLPSGMVRLARGSFGASLHLDALSAEELSDLASTLGLRGFSPRASLRLHEHTGGSPLYARALLTELPEDLWQGSLSRLPAPRSFEALVKDRLGHLSPAARAAVNAAAVLGTQFRLDDAVRIAELESDAAAIDEAVEAGLLALDDAEDRLRMRFEHPLVQAVVYGQLAPGRRSSLHLAAAAQMTDEWARLRHRAAAVTTEEESLAGELDVFGERQRSRGAWALAAAAFAEGAKISPDEDQARELLLKGIYALLFQGDVAQASEYLPEIQRFPPSPQRDAVLGFLLGLSGRREEATTLTRRAWKACDPAKNSALAAVIASRLAMQSMVGLRGEETVRWSRTAMELMRSSRGVEAPAELLPLGVGLAYAGRLAEGLSALDKAIDRVDGSYGPAGGVSLKRARGWLRYVSGDMEGARTDLSEEAAEALRIGSLGTAALALAHLGYVEYLAGDWDDALMHASRAIVITTELAHPIRHWGLYVAAIVGAARGDYDDAEGHLRAFGTSAVREGQAAVLRAIPEAHLGAARGHPDDVLLALEPVVDFQPREGIDEPGFWPWQHLYADALVSTEQFAAAEDVLRQYEQLARERHHVATMARLARSRGGLEATLGRHELSDRSFARALHLLDGETLPFETAMVQLAWGQALRRRSRRHAAAERLTAARDAFDRLGARPYRERCENELLACGLRPAKRNDFDRDRLTPQELAVARLVASGLTNREVAAELVVSVRTVEFHLTHVYAKLNIKSRGQLAALASQKGEL